MQALNIWGASWILLLFSHYSSALVAQSSCPSSYLHCLDIRWRGTGFPHVERDGGGGGSLNGKNIIVYSDTTTTDVAGGFVNFSSNSYAFVLDPKVPLKLRDFDSVEKPKVPTEVVSWHGTETVTINYVWPNSKSRFITSKLSEALLL